MRICLAQIASTKGDIADNVRHHVTVLNRVENLRPNLVMFPELSLSSYAPDIAASCAVEAQDWRLDPFQSFADSSGMVVGVGVPIRGPDRPLVSVLLFSPHAGRRVISKRFLHADEIEFFAPAVGPAEVLELGVKVAVAICHEASVAAHLEEAVRSGSEVYLASVAKTAAGMSAARASLSEKARDHRVPILVVNCVGECEGKAAGGGSCVIDPTGAVIAELDDASEGLLLYDCDTAGAAAEEIGDAGREASRPDGDAPASGSAAGP